MPLIIRPIAVQDKAAWHELYLGYLKFYESEPIESSTELVWQRLTTDQKVGGSSPSKRT